LVTVDPAFKLLYDDVYAAFVADNPFADPSTDPRLTVTFYEKVNARFDFTERDAPALHCEFEGSRIHDVYEVLDFAHVHCDTSGFWGFACDVLNFVISLFLGLPKLIAAAAAWASADDGSLSDAGGGDIRLGDPIVVRGRWAFDSAHSGYNEIHAVRTVHKTLPAPPENDIPAFIAFHNFWCSELARVPPPPRHPHAPDPTGDRDVPFTHDQRATYDAQQKEENRWVYHPVIDGCEPAPLGDPGLH
jgi:hypothetical protein